MVLLHVLIFMHIYTVLGRGSHLNDQLTAISTQYDVVLIPGWWRSTTAVELPL